MTKLDQAASVVFTMLERAANRGDECPSNSMITTAIGATSNGSASLVINNLERAGLIKVERYHRARRVTIVATGKATRAIEGKAAREHWRFRSPDETPDQRSARESKASLQRQAILAGRLLHPETVKAIEDEAARLGVATSLFVTRLLWLGWECHRDEVAE